MNITTTSVRTVEAIDGEDASLLCSRVFWLFGAASTALWALASVLALAWIR